MDSFNKTWKTIKQLQSGQKRTSQQANLPKKGGPRKKLKKKQAPKKKKSKFTAEKVRLLLKKWFSKPLRYWKKNFEEWQAWCMNALSLDRSAVSDAASERSIIERFAKPKRFMLYKKMGLKELKNEGLGWDEFLTEQMIAEGVLKAEVQDSKTGKIYTAELTKTQKREILLAKRAAQAIESDDNHGVSAPFAEIAVESDDDEDLSDENDNEEAPADNEEAEDSDVQHYMTVANNNNNNQRTLEMKKELDLNLPPKISSKNDDVMLSSLQNIDDMMFDLSQATGKDVKSGANEQPLFDMEEMMIGALDRMKEQRIKEIKNEKMKDEEKFGDMISQGIMHVIDNLTNGDLKMQLFSLSLNAPLSSLFFAWTQANFGALVEFYGVGLGVDTFGLKVAKIMQQGESSYQAFLQQWMLWRTLYEDNVREIIAKIDELMNQVIDEANMPDLDADDDGQAELEAERSVRVMQQEASGNKNQSLTKNNDKLEIPSDDEE